MGFYRFKKNWARLWMQLADTPLLRGAAVRMAAMSVPPFYGRVTLAKLHPKGFISPDALIHHADLEMGEHCFVDDGVTIYQDKNGGGVRLGNAIVIFRGTTIQTGLGGHIVIGDGTHIQPRCQFSAYQGAIHIGQRVEIAPNCAFYPYNHGIAAGIPIREQPIYTRKGIAVGDDAWLGYGVILLDGARIGRGAVIGAGSVVTSEIPDGAVAMGTPAKVTRMRS